MTTMSRPARRPIGVATAGTEPNGMPRPTAPGSAPRPLAVDDAALARRPWTVRVGDVVVLVRGSRAADLAAVAALHHRCSPTTLLDRYRCGGNPPSVSALQHMLARPHTVVATTGAGRVVAWGAADPELARPRATRPVVPDTRAEIGVIVEDTWQGLGLGRALVRHLAAAAALGGIRELVTPSTTSAAVSARLLGEIGSTKRIEVDGVPMLRTLLPESAALGLGALQRLGVAGTRLVHRTG